MKKIILLFAMICAGQLYGMEQPKPDYMASLPKEVQSLIIVALQTGNDLDGTIRDIKATSLTNKTLNRMINLNDLKSFTAIVHWLADKFNKRPIDIALKFKTQVAKEYSDLYAKLESLVSRQPDATEVKILLDKGLVDINAGPILYMAIFPVMSGQPIAAMIKLLLEYGANPNAKGGSGDSQTALDFLNRFKHTNNIDKEEAIALLEKAMQKQQQ